MNDTELFALAVIARAESEELLQENEDRLRRGESIAYLTGTVSQLDSIVALNRELRCRRVIGEQQDVTP